MERFCPNGWGCKQLPMEVKTQRGHSRCDSVVLARVASPGPFHCSVTDHEKQTILWLSPLISLAYSACQCWCFWDLSKEQNSWDSDTCAVSCYSLSLVFLGGGKKKAIKTPTTLNTRPGHVSQGSLANTQKCIQCILFSGISLAVNKCSCLLVLKWYVIMNFPRDGNVIATFLIKG